MNIIVLIPAVFFLVVIIDKVKLFIKINYFSIPVIGTIINIKKNKIFTRNLTGILQGGPNISIKLSYGFSINNSTHKTINDTILVTPKSKLNNLKKGDNINIYILMKDNKIKNTWIHKPNLYNLIPIIIMFSLLIIVSYLTRNL